MDGTTLISLFMETLTLWLLRASPAESTFCFWQIFFCDAVIFSSLLFGDSQTQTPLLFGIILANMGVLSNCRNAPAIQNAHLATDAKGLADP